MAATILYLTELLELPVFDLKGRTIGRIKEAAVVPLEDPRRIDRFMIGGGESWLTVKYDQVRSISLDGIELHDEKLTPFHSDEYLLRMVRDLLDQQIIDAHGRKVVRVTDVTFEVRPAEGFAALHVVEVDIGLRSILRRLLQGAMPRRWIRWLQQPVSPRSISWDACNIIEPDPMRRLKLDISSKMLEEMHPADLADIVEELGPEGREAVLTSMDSEAAAEALSEVDPDIQASILESLDSDQAAKLLDEMSPDEAADVLQDLQDEKSEEILDEMTLETKEDVEELLLYDERTAGGLMNVEYIALPLQSTVRDAREVLRQGDGQAENTFAVFLVDEEQRLTGTVSIVKLLLAGEDDRLCDLEGEPIKGVPPGTKEEKVAEIFDRYNLLVLPVVDHNRLLLGVITADDVIALLRRKK